MEYMLAFLLLPFSVKSISSKPTQTSGVAEILLNVGRGLILKKNNYAVMMVIYQTNIFMCVNVLPSICV